MRYRDAVQVSYQRNEELQHNEFSCLNSASHFFGLVKSDFCLFMQFFISSQASSRYTRSSLDLTNAQSTCLSSSTPPCPIPTLMRVHLDLNLPLQTRNPNPNPNPILNPNISKRTIATITPIPTTTNPLNILDRIKMGKTRNTKTSRRHSLHLLPNPHSNIIYLKCDYRSPRNSLQIGWRAQEKFSMVCS